MSNIIIPCLVVLFCVAIFKRTGSISRVVRFLVGYCLWPIGMLLLGGILGLRINPVFMIPGGFIGFFAGIVIAFLNAAKHNDIQ